MKVVRTVWAVTILLFILISSFTPMSRSYAIGNESELTKARVRAVIDLETIEIDQGEKIKLYGVNSDYYEKYLASYKEEDFFKTKTGVIAGVSKAYFKGESIEHLVHRALQFYKELLIGRSVYLKEVRTSQSYIVYLDHDRKHSLNQIAVTSGYVTVSNDNQELPDLLIQQEEARNAKTGLWNITVFIKDAGGWSENNFVYVALTLVILNFVVSMFIYVLYTRNRSLLGTIAVYAGFITTAVATIGIYSYNEMQLFFWVPPMIIVIFALIGIGEFVYFIYSKKEKSLLFVTAEIVLYIMLVIAGFGILYQGYSNNIRTQTEISYALPNFNYESGIRTEEPTGNYVAIPENEYKRTEHGEVDFKSIERVKYNLSFLNAIYFSATTFFTVGYGDFSPKGFLKIISVIQMIIGYLSQVILFSLLLSKIASFGSKIETLASKDTIHSFPSRKSKHQSKQLFNKYTVIGLYIFYLIENLWLLYKFGR